MLNFLSALAASDTSRVCDPNNVKDILCNAIRLGGVSDLPSLAGKLMADTGQLIGLLAIAAIVYAGFRMVMANGDKAQIESAKKVLTYAVMGLVISVMAYAGVVALENFIGVKALPSTGVISTQPTNPLGYSNLTDFATAMVKNIMMIIGVVSLLMIIINGFKYVTSRGDTAQLDSAKKGLTWAVAGVGLSILAYTLVAAIANFLTK